MSRSYKKYPFCKDRESCKWGKKYCNKQVRKTKDLPNGNFYRKVANHWDYIYDYWDSNTFEEYKDWIKRWGYEEDGNEHFEWYKIYKMK